MDIYADFDQKDYDRDYTKEEIKNMTDEEYLRLQYVYTCWNGSEDWKKRVKKQMEEDYPDHIARPEYRNLSADVWLNHMMA